MHWMVQPGNTKRGSIAVPLTSSLTGLESDVRLLTIFVFICKTDKSKPVKQEVHSTVILPPLVFPDPAMDHAMAVSYGCKTFIKSITDQQVSAEVLRTEEDTREKTTLRWKMVTMDNW